MQELEFKPLILHLYTLNGQFLDIILFNKKKGQIPLLILLV